MNDESTNLDRLHDLVSPPDISWWPVASGWYVVAGVIATLLVVLAIRGFLKWKSNAYRREALRELETATDVTSIAEIIRRTALSIAPRSFIASTTGEAWTGWLAGLARVPMPDEVRIQLVRGAYDTKESPADLTSLRAYAAAWIHEHRPAHQSRHSSVVNEPDGVGVRSGINDRG